MHFLKLNDKHIIQLEAIAEIYPDRPHKYDPDKTYYRIFMIGDSKEIDSNNQYIHGYAITEDKYQQIVKKLEDLEILDNLDSD